MEAIFHEKQEGSLCAQHCLNALLQNQYFSAVELAQIAQNLDEQERQHMLEGGFESQEYQRFLAQPSSNYDDSGFFSIQVLQEALRVWGLELVPFTSQNPVAREAQLDPTAQKAYICNFRQHWFCVRKLGNQWFNLNSLLTGPELISDTYLSLFLTQLQKEGYSLFIVIGELMESEADQLLRIIPAVQPIKPSLMTTDGQGQESYRGQGGRQDEDGHDQYLLQMALAESRQMVDQDDTALQQALQDSIAGCIDGSISSGATVSNVHNPSSSTITDTAKQPSPEELRKKRLAFLEAQKSNAAGSSNAVAMPSSSAKGESSEDAMLQEALKLSMEQPQ